MAKLAIREVKADCGSLIVSFTLCSSIGEWHAQNTTRATVMEGKFFEVLFIRFQE